MSMFDLLKVVVGPQTLSYQVEIAPGSPLYTSQDMESTNRVYQLLPAIASHVCVNPNGDTFQAVMANTEIAHLLEHVVIELLAQTGRVGFVTGRTQRVHDAAGENVFETSLSCEDDTLTMASLSAAIWLCEWAFAGGNAQTPNVEATVSGLSALIDKIDRVPSRR
ncbi:MAG: hypothetical protein Q4E22_02980 [Coriobacteriia bacterium]|nr:hypothetical protein [Coriobacteriia bacterium]